VLENQICYDVKNANQIYELCDTRFSLHTRIYNHKTGAFAKDIAPIWMLNEESTAKAIENMMVDAMLAAEPYLKIASQIYDPKRYLELTDDIRTEIQRSQAPVSTYVLRISTSLDDNTWFQELLEAQSILERIQNRDLYRCVEYKLFDWEHREFLQENITPEDIVAEAKRECSARAASGQPAAESDPETDDESDDISSEDIEDLTKENVIVSFSTMHYGMKEKNPLDFVKFYTKREPNSMQYCVRVVSNAVSNQYLECRHVQRGDLSLLMPQQFAEVLLRVYTKDVRYAHYLSGCLGV
jgi:hypothetical protein